MPRLVLAAVLSAAVVLGFSVSAAAAAEEPVLTGPVIVDPVDGSKLDLWNGTFSIDFSDAPASIYRIKLSAYGGAWTYDTGGSYDSTAGVQDFHFWDAVRSTDVTVTVQAVDFPDATDTSTFHVTGAPGPEVTDIEDEQTVPGWDGYVDVDFTGAPYGEWQIALYTDATGSLTPRTVVWDGTPGTAQRRIRIENPPTYGYHSVRFLHDGVSYSERSWTNAEVVRVDGLRLSADTFYPTVRDGFQDTVQASWRLSTAGSTVARVLDSRGRVVRTWDGRQLTRRDAGRQSVLWNGRSQSGAKLPVGDYTLRVVSTDANGATDSAEAVVGIVSDQVKDTRTLTRSGTDTSRRIRRGDCYYDGYGGQLSIDCWGYTGGSAAEARYSFVLPPSATHLRYQVKGAVRCCAQGELDRGLVRTGKTAAYVYVHLTRLRAFTVNRAVLTYDYLRRR